MKRITSLVLCVLIFSSGSAEAAKIVVGGALKTPGVNIPVVPPAGMGLTVGPGADTIAPRIDLSIKTITITPHVPFTAPIVINGLQGVEVPSRAEAAAVLSAHPEAYKVFVERKAANDEAYGPADRRVFPKFGTLRVLPREQGDDWTPAERAKSPKQSIGLVDLALKTLGLPTGKPGDEFKPSPQSLSRMMDGAGAQNGSAPVPQDFSASDSNLNANYGRGAAFPLNMPHLEPTYAQQEADYGPAVRSEPTQPRKPEAPAAKPERPAPARVNWWYRAWTALLVPLFRTLYSIRIRGLENLPKEGGVLLLPNHVTWIDVFLLTHVTGRPIRFLMFKPYYEHPLIHWFVKGFRPIPIEPGNPEQVTWALEEARKGLENGDAVAIFPEGSFTGTGHMKKFKRGMETIAKDLTVPVLPVYMDGLWGSFFSRRKGATFWNSVKNWFRGNSRSLYVRYGKPLTEMTVDAARDAAEQLSALALRERVLTERLPLGRAFIRSAFKNWKHTAVSDTTGVSLSYGKFLTGTALLSRVFARRIGPARNVGVMLPPSVGGSLANAALAVLNRTALNINYTASPESVEASLKHAGVKTVITSRRFVDELKARGGREFPLDVTGIYLEDLKDKIPEWKKKLTFIAMKLLGRRLSERLFFPQAKRSDMADDAALIATSGSTGTPKLVRLTHMNVQGNIKMMEEIFNFTNKDVMLGVLPFFHSFGFTETLWMPLLNGIHSTFHMNPFDTDSIQAASLKHKPTILLGTPTFLRRYAERISQEAFATLKVIVAGAEKLYVRDADGFEGKFGVRPLEGYGATETAPVSAVGVPHSYRIKDGERVVAQEGHRDNSVGMPPPGVAIRIVDPETGKVLPAGAEGLVLIKGPHVMPGYYRDALRTGEALKDGWYYSGDMGYRDREGFLFLTGRMSRFSKIAGEMVSHGLVEEKLQEVSGRLERHFVVAGAPDARFGEKLVVLYKEVGMTPEELSRGLRSHVPGIAVPKQVNYYLVQDFPMLGSGKLDLKAVQELALKLNEERHGTLDAPRLGAARGDVRDSDAPTRPSALYKDANPSEDPNRDRPQYSAGRKF